ncbi:AtpZ/AtpI family protein [Marihabitans asiaticum]|uniref:AtpZ/AtpI family protein n=1 Tax=Marihabitans asiaticum TaxID=415218 RepID=A0A560W8D6_9MICO|nr:AtpZ/AtpI family protein [Marihabitans asiaticum]TWD13887.1 hypothetical protein FB557_2529 [Marihabitans asiaticum]
MTPLRPRATERPDAAPAPRLVTKKDVSNVDLAWTTGEDPHPAAQADALGATVIAYLITGPLLFGGIGWLLDAWLGTGAFLPLGVVGGMVLSLYTIWLRYGTTQAPTIERGDATQTGAEPQNEENQ